MATAIVMPRQGNTVETCVISSWNRKKGDQVKQGESLFTYETDKATFEFESPVSGTLLDVFFGTGEDIPVLTNVAVVGAAGENYDSLKPAAGKEAAPAVVSSGPEPGKEPAAAQPPTASALISETAGTSSASPRAKMVAENKSVDISQIAGSGPHGRIIERDVLAAAASGKTLTKTALAGVAAGKKSPMGGSAIGGRVALRDLSDKVMTGASDVKDEIVEEKLTNIRKIIGQKMYASLHDSAQLTMHSSANVSKLLALRASIKQSGKEMGLADITLGDMVCFALAQTLVKFPDVNALYTGETVKKFGHVHLAVAVDTPRGLMVPVVRFADCLTLNDLAVSIKNNTTACLEGSINPDRLSGGTITVTNIGSSGVEMFTPVLNPPQVAILGVCAITQRAVVSESGGVALAPYMGFSLTIDHRVLDGAPGAKFLKSFCQAIENFDVLLLA